MQLPNLTNDEMQKRLDQLMGLFKILLGFMQIISTMAVNLPEVPWPDSLTVTWSMLGVIANIDLFEGIAVDCVTSSYTFYDTFLITILYPIFLMVIIVAVTKYRQNHAESTEVAETCLDEGWKVSLFLMFLLYPSISATVLRVWNCRDIEGTSYVRADYTLVCSTPSGTEGEWASYASIAAFAFVLYPIGIPALFAYVLYENQESLHDEDHPDHASTFAKFGFLYSSYTEDVFWWEIIMLVNKLLLTGLIIFIKPGTVSQLACGFVIAIVFFILHVRYRAFADLVQGDLQFCSMLSIVMTLFGGILLQTKSVEEEEPNGKAAMAGLLMAINIGVIVLFIYQTVMAVKAPPSDPLMVKIINATIAKCVHEATENVHLVVDALGYEEVQAKAIRSALIKIIKRLPVIINATEEFEAITDEFQACFLEMKDPTAVITKMVKLTVAIIGENEVAQMFRPIASYMLKTSIKVVADKCASPGETLTPMIAATSNKIVDFSSACLIKDGLEDFSKKWTEDVPLLISEMAGFEEENIKDLLDSIKATFARDLDATDLENAVSSVELTMPEGHDGVQIPIFAFPSMGSATSHNPTAEATYFTREQKELGRKIFARYDMVRHLLLFHQQNYQRFLTCFLLPIG